MTPAKFNNKYDKVDKQRTEDWWAAVKQWLVDHPDKYIAFRTYVPGFMDGETCLPCIDYIGAAPGFVDGEFYITIDGAVIDLWEVVISMLPKEEQAIFEVLENMDAKERHLRIEEFRDLQLEKLLYNGYYQYVEEWDVTGTMKIVKDRRRRNHGEVGIDTTPYECEY